MTIAQEQMLEVGGAAFLGRDPLITPDEYDYCRVTKG
jgi:hypothetical protein